MRNCLKIIGSWAIALCFASAALAAGHPRYAEGQVWEYKTRVGDEGSLLKVQKIESLPGKGPVRQVYHVSIIGIHFAGPYDGELQHAPFSRAALDASVTKLSNSQASFPDPAAGIAEWRAAHGGIFTVPVAVAVSITAQTVQR